jgi:peptide/nickel transport system permease protein
VTRKRFWLPSSILILWCLFALLGSYLPLTPNEVDLNHILSTPSLQYSLGNDDLGRPVLDRLIMGAQTSFWVAFQVVLISLILGTLIGTVSAWQGGIIDRVIVHIIDIFMAFPGILLAIALAGLLGPGLNNVVIALSTVGWIGFARLSRAQTLSIKHRVHVTAATALGMSTRRTLLVHVIPLLSAPLIIEATFGIAGAVISEAGLSFLGLGVQPPAASWGSMLRDGASYMLMAPHLVIAPGLALMLVVLSVNILGDQLRDHMDVRLDTK